MCVWLAWFSPAVGNVNPLGLPGVPVGSALFPKDHPHQHLRLTGAGNPLQRSWREPSVTLVPQRGAGSPGPLQLCLSPPTGALGTVEGRGGGRRFLATGL